MINVANATAKWARNLGGAAQSYTEGINSFAGNPMQLAAQQADKALQNYTEAIGSGRWSAKLGSMSREQWAGPAVKVGAQRLVSGVAKGTPKMQAALTKFAPAYEAASQAAKAIGGSGKAAAMAKQSAVYDILKQAAGKSLG